MAIVRTLEEITLDKQAEHTEANATYSIIKSTSGTFLQIDTYGSANRQIQGKKSQSIRFDTAAIKQLQLILDRHFKD